MAQAQRMMDDSKVHTPKVLAWRPLTEEKKVRLVFGVVELTTLLAYIQIVLTKIWCACVKFLRQKAVVAETLYSVAKCDHGHHDKPAP